MLYLGKEEDFEKIVSEGVTLVDFYADWCGPCNMLGPVLEEVSKGHPEVKFLKINTDQFMGLAQKFGIMSIPALKVFKDGVEVKSSVGFMDKKEIEDLIK